VHAVEDGRLDIRDLPQTWYTFGRPSVMPRADLSLRYARMAMLEEA
jgi:hypothetical protein